MASPPLPPPRISIALPVYNGEDFLEEALLSIAAQSFTDYEFVISDNASTDSTAAILDRFARDDPRIRVSRSERFLSQHENMNRAVALARTEWIKLFCHDDIMQPDCLARIVGAIDEVVTDRTGLIGNGESWLFENGAALEGRYQGHRRPVAQTGRDTIMAALGGGGSAHMLPSITTATVRRAAFDAFGGFDKRWVHFDVFYWLRLLTRWDYAFVPENLTVNRIHGAQVAIEGRRQLRSFADHRLFYPEFLSQHADELNLPRSIRLKARLKPAGVLAGAVVAEIMRGHPAAALRVALKGPLTLLPLVPLLVIRAYGRERRMLAPLRGAVSNEQLYPG